MSLQQCNYIWNKKSQENLSLSLPTKPDLCVTSDSQILVILHLSHAKTPLQYKHWVVFRAGIQQRAQLSYLLQWISLLGWLLNIPVLLFVSHWVSIWNWEIKEESASLSAKWPKRTALIAATIASQGNCTFITSSWDCRIMSTVGVQLVDRTRRPTATSRRISSPGGWCKRLL